MDCARAKTHDPDEWLEMAPDFSRTMAGQLREWFGRWEPDLREAIKWNMLCLSGRRLVCGISACKKHLSITFFRGMELPDPARLLSGGETNTNILSVRLTSLEELNANALRDLLRAAVALDVEPRLPSPPKGQRRRWPMPAFFAKALKANPRARAFFPSLKPTYQQEYIVWLSTAKREETRAKRLKETLAALAAGLKWVHRREA
jgi:uncharacterized protein YdeI (YjbR/CyaY-like superfamily)